MTDFTRFRLVVRAIGVLLIGLSLPGLLSYLGWVVTSIVSWIKVSQSSSTFDVGAGIFAIVIGFAGDLVQLGFGLYLLIGGGALIRYCTRDLVGLCASCGYDVKNLDADRCPECGTPIPKRVRPTSSEKSP